MDTAFLPLPLRWGPAGLVAPLRKLRQPVLWPSSAAAPAAWPSGVRHHLGSDFSGSRWLPMTWDL